MHPGDGIHDKWAGTATLGPGWAAFCGAAGEHSAHRHHAVQIVLGIDAPVRLWTEARGPFEAPGVVIAAGELHSLVSGEHPVQMLYVERQSPWGRMLGNWCGPGSRVIDRRRTALALLETVSSGNVSEGMRRALESSARCRTRHRGHLKTPASPA